MKKTVKTTTGCQVMWKMAKRTQHVCLCAMNDKTNANNHFTAVTQDNRS